MSRQFYFDCSSGISGDMTVAALLDLGADQAVLYRMLDSLCVEGFQVSISRVKKSGIEACDFAVKLDPVHENHDHDMSWLHGTYGLQQHHTEPQHPTELQHHTDRHHPANQQQTGAGSAHHHEHRSLGDILEIIARADMTEHARELAVRMFTILAEAEGKVHGVPADQVHFHEVGAVDSIVDILSVAVCADNLGMDRAVIPWLHEGEGMIRCQHGLIPVPVPAVTAIAEAYGLWLRPAGIEGELVTPTGAAIAACFASGEKLMPTYRILRSGTGAGKREYGLPGILRIMLLEDDSISDDEEAIVKLETDIDDCSGEALGYCMEQLFAAGARDVHYLPIYMKKNRPGYQLQVICTRAQVTRLEEIIFRETTTIGIRRIPVERTVMERKLVQVSTPWGKVRAKVCEKGKVRKVYPEYEDVADLCRKQNLPFDETFRRISVECMRTEADL